MAAVAAAAFGVIYLMDHRSAGGKAAERQNAAPDPVCLYLNDLEYEVTDNVKAYLVAGTDWGGSKPDDEHYHGPMSDYLLLLIINKTRETHGYVQIDRDTMTDIIRIGEDGDEDIADIETEQICTASWYGKDLYQGLSNLTESVSEVLGGLPIEGYYSINMEDIPRLNHAVGGVTVKIEDDFSELDPEMKPGAELHLSDEQAELFLHNRMDIGDGTNESRMRRQRAYMDALMEQARERMRVDKSFVNDLFSEMKDAAVTNIHGNRVSAIANLVYKTEPLGIKDIKGKHKLGRVGSDKQDYMQFYADEGSIAEVLTELCGLGEGREY